MLCLEGAEPEQHLTVRKESRRDRLGSGGKRQRLWGSGAGGLPVVGERGEQESCKASVGAEGKGAMTPSATAFPDVAVTGGGNSRKSSKN